MNFFTKIQSFIETYGWFILIGFLLIYYIFPNLKDNILYYFPKNKKQSISDIPTKNDDRIMNARRKQQERLDKLTQIVSEQPNSKKLFKSKKDKELDKFKKTSAYRKATTGKWGGNDRPKPGSAVDNTSRYRPNPFNRGGRRKGG